ncbi:MAG: prenyltransferase [Anaerolineales bacterium]|nr:prenyltransferase [Anaerolineales bacterium]
MQNLCRLARFSYLLPLFWGVLLYSLGVGIAHYLGIPIDYGKYTLGQIWIILIQLSSMYLNQYFETSKNTRKMNLKEIPHNRSFTASIVVLTVTASATVLLIRYGDLVPATLLVMALAFLGAFFYATPPIRLRNSPYGELINAILLSNLVPALAFTLQTDELHRMLAMSTFPLTPLYLALAISSEYPHYGNDLINKKQTILTRLGWENGMRLHNMLIITAFLLLALAVVFGMPFRNALPVFFVIPLGFFQIWYLGHIASGASPNWKALTVLGVLLYGTPAYLLSFTFWIR